MQVGAGFPRFGVILRRCLCRLHCDWWASLENRPMKVITDAGEVTHEPALLAVGDAKCAGFWRQLLFPGSLALTAS